VSKREQMIGTAPPLRVVPTTPNPGVPEKRPLDPTRAPEGSGVDWPFWLFMVCVFAIVGVFTLGLMWLAHKDDVADVKRNDEARASCLDRGGTAIEDEVGWFIECQVPAP
jgi:hypothetical protein